MAKLKDFPQLPFLTENFSPRGGGIDFLGLRWVNLELLTRYLLPGINNATQDVGTYCLGAWIPWKFEQLCSKDIKRFRLDEFTSYREAIEVALAYVLRHESPSEDKFGAARMRIGVDQKLQLPGLLNFERAKRTAATSIYAAPLYGPSLKYCGLIAGEALGENGRTVHIPVISRDPDTTTIVEELDLLFRTSKHYSWLDSTRPEHTSFEVIDNLGIHGLHPASARTASSKLKRAFANKLLPSNEQDSGYQRTLSARLILETAREKPGVETGLMRNIWYTGLLNSIKPLSLKLPGSAVQRQWWAVFMARQYQRYAIECFQRLFEIELANGGRSLHGITKTWLDAWNSKGDVPSSFSEILVQEVSAAGLTLKGDDWINVSNAWGTIVHPEHNSFDDLEPGEDEDDDLEICCRRLARWWIRAAARHQDPGLSEAMTLGGADRLSILWFWNWIDRQKNLPLEKFITEFLSRMVFSQHIRIALGRFDGQIQRVRFLLGDDGIAPAASANETFGEGFSPAWMADRLHAFVGLLCDLEIVSRDEEGGLTSGKNANWLDGKS